MKKLILLSLAATMAACQSNPPSDTSAETMQPVGPQAREAQDQVEATGANVAGNFARLNQSRQAIAAEWEGRSFEEFEATVARESGTGNYIVNGDIVLVDRKQLREFFEKEVLGNANPVGLIVHAPGGVQAVWDETTRRNLTYCISDDFGSRKSQVVADMQRAGDAWAKQGDVRFVYSPLQDARCNAVNAQVVFDVRPVNGQSYLARAFFPNDSRGNRNVLINDSSFDLSSGNLTLVGILRHELGHALGFRHEHTRPESGECFEDSDWVPMTSYDAFSVMHYPQCNGRGDWSLKLTAKDKLGICKVYGAGPSFAGDTSQCAAAPTPPSADTCGPQVVRRFGQLAQNESEQVGSFDVTAGSSLEVSMTGSGDPDLYLRFNSAPTESDYDCRPYLSGPNETCELTVPQNASEAHVMVRGYTAGNYAVQVTITGAPAP